MNEEEQNEISHIFLQGSDLVEREEEVLEDAATKTGFVPQQIIGRSAWWGSTEIGAFHVSGEYQGKKAILKVQGVKPAISEIYMIESFARTNKSRVLRPPDLYTSIPWDNQRRYEALVMEFIEGDTIIHLPTNPREVQRFFQLYQDYRTNCLQNPWVDKPKESIPDKIKGNFQRWRQSSLRIYPNHPLREDGDDNLINQAVEVLIRGYQKVEPQFQHGHLADADLYRVGDQIVVLSNLFWSWRSPFYDAIFCYHWFMYHLNDVPQISPNQVESQRDLWLSQIYNLVKTNDKRTLLQLALLERAAAGLNLDVLSADPNKPITRHLIESTRKQIRELIGQFA